MSMGVSVPFVMYCNIGAHSIFDKVLPHIVPDKFYLFVPVQLDRQGNFILPRKPRFAAFLLPLYFVPKDSPVLIFLRGVFAQHHFGINHAALVGVVVGYPVIIVCQSFAASIGGGSNSGTPLPSADYLTMTMIDSHSSRTPFPSSVAPVPVSSR